MAITKIIISCSDDTMGDTTPAECDAYRTWFAEQLRAEYPEAQITVTAEPGRLIVQTDDEDNEFDAAEALHEFSQQCWESCPWDWVEKA